MACGLGLANLMWNVLLVELTPFAFGGALWMFRFKV